MTILEAVKAVLDAHEYAGRCECGFVSPRSEPLYESWKQHRAECVARGIEAAIEASLSGYRRGGTVYQVRRNSGVAAFIREASLGTSWVAEKDRT